MERSVCIVRIKRQEMMVLLQVANLIDSLFVNFQDLVILVIKISSNLLGKERPKNVALKYEFEG